MMAGWWILLCALATAGLVWADARASAAGRWASKPLASLAFVGLAWQQGAWESAYGQAILGALLLCLVGDLLLIPDRTGPAFVAGLLAFLFGHIAFAAAALLRGPAPVAAIGALALICGPVLLALRWLRPHLRGPLRLAVPVYGAAIGAMVGLSWAAGLACGSWLLPVGASAFLLSDLSVARDRFVAPSWRNRLWGLPLYYGAQVLLALSVGEAALRTRA